MLLCRGIQAFSGEEVLISGGGDGVIRSWGLDKETGGLRKIGNLEDGRDAGESVLTMALDGSFLYSGRVEGEINVWDLETRQLLRTMRPHDHDILSLTYGGGYVFAAADDGSVTVRELCTSIGESLTQSSDSTTGMSGSAAGKLIVA
jgi:di- and tripeptidase